MKNSMIKLTLTKKIAMAVTILCIFSFALFGGLYARAYYVVSGSNIDGGTIHDNGSIDFSSTDNEIRNLGSIDFEEYSIDETAPTDVVDRGIIDTSDYIEVECESIAIGEDTYQMVTPDGDVIAVYTITPYESDPTPRTKYTFETELPTNASWRGNYSFTSNGTVFSYSVELSETGSSKIGVYSHDNGRYYWGVTVSDSYSGSFDFTQDLGHVAFAFRNESGHDITYSGYYIPTLAS